MLRKPGLNPEFVMFDVVYEGGTQRSNRQEPRTLTGGLDGDKPAHEFLIEMTATSRRNPAGRRPGSRASPAPAPPNAAPAEL
jgi:hypothetical protein